MKGSTRKNSQLAYGKKRGTMKSQLEKTMTLKRIFRLIIAPFKGFFITSWRYRTPKRPPKETFWEETKQIMADDFRDYWVPFSCAVKEFKDELNRRD
jgi:hypothetical protein